MDAGKLVLLGGAGAAVWWFYFRTPSAAAAGAAAPAIPATATPVAPALPSLDVLFARMVAASTGDSAIVSGMASPDVWNSYLMQVYPAVGTLPDPTIQFGPRPMPAVTAATYWTVMAVYLKTHFGLSGIGRFGLGAVASLSWGRGF